MISQFTSPFLYEMDLTAYYIILSDEEKRTVAVHICAL